MKNELVKLTNVERRAAQVELPKDEGGAVVLDPAKLPPAFELRATAILKRTCDAMHKFGRAGLALGEVLLEARELFKPVGLWMAFLRRVPGLSAKTADRLIKRYEMARKVLPELVLAVALAGGVALAGESEDAPYGKFTKAARKVGPPPRDGGKDPVRELERARSWVAQVVTARVAELKRIRNRAEKVAPVERDAQILVRKAEVHGDTPDAQAQYVREVTLRAIKLLGATIPTIALLKKSVAGVGKAA